MIKESVRLIRNEWIPEEEIPVTMAVDKDAEVLFHHCTADLGKSV